MEFNPTLEESFQIYLRRSDGSPKFIHDMRSIIKRAFWAWIDRPVLSITDDEIHARINVVFLNKGAQKEKARKLIKRLQRLTEEENELGKAPEFPPTLEEIMPKYLRIRKLKPSTIQAYGNLVSSTFRDWKELSMNDIHPKMILDKYLEMSKDAPYSASYSMRMLKAVYNFAIKYSTNSRGERLVKENPVEILGDLRAWNRVYRRRTIVFKQQLPTWLQGVLKLRYPPSRDMFLFVWLTGCRPGEARELQWKDVQLDLGIVTFRDTKNHLDHTIPICSFLIKLLSGRRILASRGSDYVFPGLDGGEINNNSKGYRTMCNKMHIANMPYDLRRLYITTCNALQVPDSTIKYLVNHSQRNDVTAGYIVRDPENERPVVEMVARRLLEDAHFDFESESLIFSTPRSNVLPMHKNRIGIISTPPVISIFEQKVALQ